MLKARSEIKIRPSPDREPVGRGRLGLLRECQPASKEYAPNECDGRLPKHAMPLIARGQGSHDSYAALPSARLPVAPALPGRVERWEILQRNTELLLAC